MPAGLPCQHVHLDVVHICSVPIVGGDTGIGYRGGGGLDSARDELLALGVRDELLAPAGPLPESGLLAAVRAILLRTEGEFLGPDKEDVGWH